MWLKQQLHSAFTVPPVFVWLRKGVLFHIADVLNS